LQYIEIHYSDLGGNRIRGIFQTVIELIVASTSGSIFRKLEKISIKEID